MTCIKYCYQIIPSPVRMTEKVCHFIQTVNQRERMYGNQSSSIARQGMGAGGVASNGKMILKGCSIHKNKLRQLMLILVFQRVESFLGSRPYPSPHLAVGLDWRLKKKREQDYYPLGFCYSICILDNKTLKKQPWQNPIYHLLQYLTLTIPLAIYYYGALNGRKILNCIYTKESPTVEFLPEILGYMAFQIDMQVKPMQQHLG